MVGAQFSSLTYLCVSNARPSNALSSQKNCFHEKISFDLPGVGLLTIALLLLLFPLISNGANDFKPVDYFLMALSIPLFIILYKWSVYQEKKGNQPLIAPNLLKTINLFQVCSYRLFTLLLLQVFSLSYL